MTAKLLLALPGALLILAALLLAAGVARGGTTNV